MNLDKHDSHDSEDPELNLEKGESAAEVRYHAHDQRKHYRLSAPLHVVINKRSYTTKDWSVGGLSIENFEEPTQTGELLKLRVTIKFQGFNLQFPLKGEVLESSNHQKNLLRVTFQEVSKRSENILKLFSQSLLSGEMVNVEDAIKRIDIPIDEEAERLERLKKIQGPIGSWPVKTILFSTVYLTVGLCLFVYLSLIFYVYFLHLKVESTVVSAPVEPLVSPFDGTIANLTMTKGQLFKKGEPLLSINDDKLQLLYDVEKTNADLEEKNKELAYKNLTAESNRLDIYSKISTERSGSSVSDFSASRERLDKLRKDYERAKELYNQHVLAKSDFEKFETDYLNTIQDLQKAKFEVEVQKHAAEALSNGTYFSGNQIESKLPEMQAAAKLADQKVTIEQKRLAAFKEQIDQRTLIAPFDGQVVDVLISQNNTVSRGDNLLMIEQNEKRFITAYLTQEESLLVKADSPVKVYVPSIDLTLNGIVSKIDRTSGFIDDMRAIYVPREREDRTAIVVITLPENSVEELRKELLPGTPAIAYFERSLFQGFKTRLALLMGGKSISQNSTPNPEENPQNNNEIDTEKKSKSWFDLISRMISPGTEKSQVQ